MTKTKKFALSLVAVAACARAFGTYECYQQSGEYDALLAENVEALSFVETKDSNLRSFPCYHTSGTECRYSTDKNRPTCWKRAYC